MAGRQRTGTVDGTAASNGAVYLGNSIATLDDVTFQDGTADRGGALSGVNSTITVLKFSTPRAETLRTEVL